MLPEEVGPALAGHAVVQAGTAYFAEVKPRLSVDNGSLFQYIGIMSKERAGHTAEMIAALAALAHETRLAAFRRLLRAGRAGIAQGRLAGDLRVPAQTLSFHLKQMTAARIVLSRREGTTIYYSVDFDSVRNLGRFLTESCCVERVGRASRRGKS